MEQVQALAKYINLILDILNSQDSFSDREDLEIKAACERWLENYYNFNGDKKNTYTGWKHIERFLFN